MLDNHQQDCNCSFTIKDSDYLEDDVCVYKLTGSVLVKYATSETRINVDVDRRYPCTKKSELDKSEC